MWFVKFARPEKHTPIEKTSSLDHRYSSPGVVSGGVYLIMMSFSKRGYSLIF